MNSEGFSMVLGSMVIFLVEPSGLGFYEKYSWCFYGSHGVSSDLLLGRRWFLRILLPFDIGFLLVSHGFGLGFKVSGKEVEFFW